MLGSCGDDQHISRGGKSKQRQQGINSIRLLSLPSKSFTVSLGYGFHFQHRNSGTFPIESLAHDSGRTLVRAEDGYPKGSPNTNGYSY
jgi:hypothetical protein